MSYAKQIQKRIADAEDGAIFIGSDFADIAGKDTVRRSLNRIAQQGVIRRVIKGVYEKPKFSKLLQENVTTDPNAVAHAIARSYSWTIIPCGNTALNILGISTQVPASWCFYSDGPYKTYAWENVTIKFKRRVNKEITNLSSITALVIHALKTLGEENVTDETIAIISSKLSKKDKMTLLQEGKNSTSWVFDIIRQINKEQM